MSKRLVAMGLLAAMLLSAGSMAQAEEIKPYDGPEWTFEVPLSELDDKLLVLASPLSPLEDTSEPKRLVSVVSRKSGENGENVNGGIRKAANTSMQLTRETYNALTMLFAAAEEDGVELYIRQGYRSYADQEERYARAESQGKTDGVAKPGETDYQTGLAATIVGKAWRAKTLDETFAASEEYAWLAAHAARYGFIIRYPEGKESVTGAAFEPWHLRYEGADTAQYMYRNDLCLEEFLAAKADAESEFISRGGDLDAAIRAERLPEGPVILQDQGPDGDHEITIFHE